MCGINPCSWKRRLHWLGQSFVGTVTCQPTLNFHRYCSLVLSHGCNQYSSRCRTSRWLFNVLNPLSGTRYCSQWAFGPGKDLPLCESTLLVAQTLHMGEHIRAHIWNVSTGQKLDTLGCAARYLARTHWVLRFHQYGLCALSSQRQRWQYGHRGICRPFK